MIKTNDIQHEKLGDEQLLILSISNPSVFTILYDRYEEAFLRKASKILLNKEQAEDAVQDTFVKIYAYAKKFKKEGSGTFKSWAYTILLNTCFKVYKKQKYDYLGQTSLDDELDAIVADSHVAKDFDNKLTVDYLLSYISKLPVALANVVRLHFLDGRPQKEVASLEGISESLVRVRIHRAKKELRKIITSFV